MTLYNCKHVGDEYRITKFDNHMNVESSYLCTEFECECPAGVRPSCRHRQMLPKFIERGAVNVNWMLDFDRGGWVDNRSQDELDQSAEKHDGDEWREQNEVLPLPPGVQAFSLDDPAALHNAIAEAVGEPEAIIQPHSAAASTADFDSANAGSNPAGVAISQVPAKATFRRF